MIAPELNSMPAVMKRRVALSVLLLSLLGSAGGVWAQQGYWRELPPDERRQIRQEMREHWQQEREIRQQEGAPRWRDVPPDERRELRQQIREQRGWAEQRERRGGRNWR